jgi:predicted Rossmann-fold nucleotide-binding protein
VPRQFARVYHIFNMEWGVKENHVAVIVLHNCGKSSSKIFRLLKPLKISQMFISRAIEHCKELCRVEQRARSGSLKSVRAEDVGHFLASEVP